MNVAAHQEKENTKAEKARGREKTGDRFLKKLRAALLRSFKGGSTAQKRVFVRRVPGGTGILEKANSHFDPIQTGSGTASPR